MPLLAGDVVVLATDGLFDNVTGDEVLRVAVDALAETNSTSIAQRILERAHAHSLDRERDSPFALLAKENMILWRYGGRPDDITVLGALYAQEHSADVCHLVSRLTVHLLHSLPDRGRFGRARRAGSARVPAARDASLPMKACTCVYFKWENSQEWRVTRAQFANAACRVLECAAKPLAITTKIKTECVVAVDRCHRT